MSAKLLERNLLHRASGLRLAFKTGSARATRFNSTTSPTNQLNWQEFLKLRGSRRKWQAVTTIPASVLGFLGGVAYFGNLETDPTKLIMGVDPFMFYGFCTVGCVGAGALIGPTIGSAIWRFSNRNSIALIDVREREFLQHIAKKRVDPTLQSPTNPIPDYYGEKIGSLHQYRQWLRDQGKYRRKHVLPEN
ncbi:TIM23 complex component [Pleurotus ostreatus]|uniref:Presequence translocated-associated motor subunit PAM17 n=1 Tax=Pleurotus ostreatus TaxID=5322 RepID=A0A8H7A1H4_PLEOS|nr:TIM23 complex component [Pleurotus ostreatus]KAF7440263.1 TIM23 complex component [Pleurotus ostreatus]KAJ8700442.1 TIM23 complex component [Pleurotus ostreatus]